MLSSTVQWRTSTRQVPRQTRRQYDLAALLVLPEVVDGELRRVTCSIHVEVQHPTVRLFQLPITVQIICEELLPMLCNTCVYKYTINAAEARKGLLESSALRGPGCNVAGVDKEVRRVMLKRLGWRVEIDQSKVVLGVEGGEELRCCKTDSGRATCDDKGLGC